MRQRDLPDYRYCSIKLQLDLIDMLAAEAKRQERSIAGEVAYRLRRSFEGNSAQDEAA
jgi:hypothetical protein